VGRNRHFDGQQIEQRGKFDDSDQRYRPTLSLNGIAYGVATTVASCQRLPWLSVSGFLSLLALSHGTAGVAIKIA